MKNIEKLYSYFTSKTKEISAISEQAIFSHNGLIGEHRERIINAFLKDFLPNKYSVGTGQFMSVEFQRDFESNQSDIIIWDSLDYPKIHLQSTSDLFFAESVKMVIEVKSVFNNNEFQDIIKKSRHLKTFVPNFHPSIKDEIWRLDNKIVRTLAGKMEMKIMASAPMIAMAAMCFKGGENFTLKDILTPSEIEDDLPDVLLLLNAGKMVAKTYEITEPGVVKGELALYQLNDNSLIGFTGWITSLLAERDTLTNSPFQFHEYITDVFKGCKIETLKFPVLRFPSGIEIIN
jgi:hypothetical protein